MVDDIFDQLSRILRVSSSSLQGIGLITNVILPFLLFSYALKCFLEGMRIFGYSRRIYWGLAFVVSFIAMPILSTLSFIVVPASIFVIVWMKYKHRLKMNLIILLVVIGLIIWFLLPGIISLILGFLR